jgi:hypothetical protein
VSGFAAALCYRKGRYRAGATKRDDWIQNLEPRYLELELPESRPVEHARPTESFRSIGEGISHRHAKDRSVPILTGDGRPEGQGYLPAGQP